MTTRENILELLDNDGFGNIVDGECVSVSRQEQLNRALVLACECGYLDLVEKLHRDGAQICGNPDALCAAADFDHLKIATYLVDNGADIDAPAQQLRQTPLMDAAGSASLRVLRYLLQIGADTDAKCDDGMTALDWARMGRNTATLPEMQPNESVLNDYDKIIDILNQNETVR